MQLIFTPQSDVMKTQTVTLKQNSLDFQRTFRKISLRHISTYCNSCKEKSCKSPSLCRGLLDNHY